MPRPSIWLVTPELHRRGGTERAFAEQVSRWRSRFNLRVYVMSVEDIELTGSVVRRVPRPAGPHLARFLWWFAANRVLRGIDERRLGRPDAVVSPGVNALDADAIGVHMVFAKYRARRPAQAIVVGHAQRWSPRSCHRALFSWLIAMLERHVYEGPPLLWSVSARDARDLEARYGRPAGTIPVVPHGVDAQVFCPERRRAERAEARAELGLDEERVVLLIGNDAWTKGVDLALGALAHLPNDVALAVAGDADDAEVRAAAALIGVQNRIRMWPRRSDPSPYFAAADVLVAPSREDAFNLPTLEAMAWGLPIVVSRHAGVTELIEDGKHGLVIDDPWNIEELAARIERALDPVAASELAQNGRELAELMGWDDNADRTAELVMREITTPRFLILAADPFGVGGIERASRTLIHALAERFGAERVGVVSLWGGRADLPARILHHGRRPAERRPVSVSERVRFATAALRTAHRWRRRLVVVATHPHLAPVAVVAGRIAGARVAVWCHGDEVWKPLRPSVRLALQRADLVFCPSRFTADQVSRWALLERQPVVVPHSVPPELVGHTRRSVRGRVLAVARMERQDRSKGIDTLIRAWPSVVESRPDAELVVVGDGADRTRLERVSRRAGSNGRVRFVGRISDPELHELYRTAAVFALPTRARVGAGAAGEGFGLVFVEAAAAGLPVVAGRSGAVPEVVEDAETGLLVDPTDPDAVAEAIGTLLDDPKLQARMGRAARARVKERFTFEQFGDRVAELLGGLASVYRSERG